MFTGIIEDTAIVEEIIHSGKNQTFRLKARIAREFHVDQSVAHNGTCLTVEEVFPESSEYRVTAIAETLQKTSLGSLKTNSIVNLERSLKANSRIDGHFVQGHVDTTGSVQSIVDQNGSTDYIITFPESFDTLIIPRGSIAVQGISLTVAETERGWFKVSIIPYTKEHTNIQDWQIGSSVNLEFDVLGKYIQKLQVAPESART